MKVTKQSVTLKVENLDTVTGGGGVSNSQTPHAFRHSYLLPDTIRCIICGPSNCGKTNVMLSLITEPNGLKFENIYLYSKTPFQPKYVLLEKILKKITNIGYFCFNTNQNIVSPQAAKPNSLFIFDDVVCDKGNVMREYFSMGRHSLIDSFYLCQTYARIPKHLIRDNANLLVLFKQDEVNLRHVYNDHVNTDMDYQRFKELCSYCWGSTTTAVADANSYGFLVIDKEKNLNTGRYRKGFDCYISVGS